MRERDRMLLMMILKRTLSHKKQKKKKKKESSLLEEIGTESKWRERTLSKKEGERKKKRKKEREKEQEVLVLDKRTKSLFSFLFTVNDVCLSSIFSLLSHSLTHSLSLKVSL